MSSFILYIAPSGNQDHNRYPVLDSDPALTFDVCFFHSRFQLGSGFRLRSRSKEIPIPFLYRVLDKTNDKYQWFDSCRYGGNSKEYAHSAAPPSLQPNKRKANIEYDKEREGEVLASIDSGTVVMSWPELHTFVKRLLSNHQNRIMTNAIEATKDTVARSARGLIDVDDLRDFDIYSQASRKT
ncbi:hypothetical protein EVAR_76367_1 [Eumeta japonica]|uniref:Uncharacterized protein n=1 Tax=Eumeta variegata TaxID=151549 RepID=A0A4C1TAS3_EUMVA|nr:hypothetical protein EVAR_76367_1 [Eumeta japonica]